MSSCRVTDAEVKILVAECLGELGAVDPGRLVLHLILFMCLVTLLHTYELRSATEKHAPVVRRLNNVFQRINCYPVDKCEQNVLCYPSDRGNIIHFSNNQGGY